ncbi:NADase-type glycan-binding domain-containing protein [Micromonospora sp. SL1-18]|uniref:NADase-type glycan-binding domain-containing protein n=1 Tax=Micromonospora sp. SL1-18 TaxID=3399128 RepID=UPI003A4DC62D
MIICAECGATNGDDDQFCGTCGEFLRWDASAATSTVRPIADGRPQTGPAGERPQTGSADERPRTEAADRPRTGEGTAGQTDNGRTDNGRTDNGRTDNGRTADRQADPEADIDPHQPAVATRVPVDAVAATGRNAPDVPPRQPADGSVTVDRAGGDTQPAPRQPGPPDQRGQPSDNPEPADPVDLPPRPPEPRRACPACGVDNAPGRRFCRSCGAQLATPAGPAPRRSWWQRWWDRLRRRTPRRRSLRDDRRATRAARRTLLIVLVLCLVAVLAVVGPPLARRAVEAVRDRTQDPTPLVPAAVTASSEAPGAGAARLTDGANNRYWAPNGAAAGAWVEGRFTEPVRLLTVVITPGVSPRRQAFLAAGRPRGLTVITIDTDGQQRETDIELRDEPGEQHFDVAASNMVRIRLVVRSTYGPGLIPSVAIGEAEFFGRR